MVQLQILSGPRAGQRWNALRFPARVGRSPQADLRIEGDGVWDWHLQIDLDPVRGVVLYPGPEALTIVNGHPASAVRLLSGDLIEAGSVKLRFGFSPTRQYDLRFREGATWAALGALCLGQIALIYWLVSS